MLVDRYMIQDVIGIGGMGSVYRARDMHFPNAIKLVAVKEMINQAPDPLVRKTIVQNFEREANILVTLNHPSIPKIFDFFTHNERSYLVEEFVNGRDLESILKQSHEPLAEEQVIAWAIELCEVLIYLHNHKPEPIIFRDIKPSNIMINQQSHVVLVDFGIAKIFKTGQKGTMIGTEGYSPPEQYRGEATLQTDIYSLGATMHHLLTQSDPRLEAPFSFNERPIRQLNPAISPDLELIISTALAYNPEDRFTSVEAMRDALMVLARKTGVLTRVASGPLIMTDQGIKPLWSFSCEDEIRGSPVHESGMIYVGSYDNNLYALDATKGEFQWKYATEGAISNKALVSNGSVYFGSADNRVYSISAATGKLLWSYATQGPVRSAPRIAEGHLFVGSDDGMMYAINLSTFQRSWSFSTEGPVRSSPVIDTHQIYFGCDSNEFICCDFRGQIKWHFFAKRPITASPIVVDGVVFFPALDATLYALDAKSGWVIWRYRMGKGSVSTPCYVDNNLFLGSADGNVYCIDRTSAKEVWRFKADAQVSGSPLVYKDSIYIGAADGVFYCIEHRTGRMRWKFQTGGAITGEPVVANDVVYFASSDHQVYALLA